MVDVVRVAGNRTDEMQDVSMRMPRPARALLLAIGLLLCTSLVHTAQDLSYTDDGLDWGGICVTSKRQSPINLVPDQYTAVNASSPSTFDFGTGRSVSVRTPLLDAGLPVHEHLGQFVCQVSCQMFCFAGIHHSTKVVLTLSTKHLCL